MGRARSPSFIHGQARMDAERVRRGQEPLPPSPDPHIRSLLPPVRALKSAASSWFEVILPRPVSRSHGGASSTTLLLSLTFASAHLFLGRAFRCCPLAPVNSEICALPIIFIPPFPATAFSFFTAAIPPATYLGDPRLDRMACFPLYTFFCNTPFRMTDPFRGSLSYSLMAIKICSPQPLHISASHSPFMPHKPCNLGVRFLILLPCPCLWGEAGGTDP